MENKNNHELQYENILKLYLDKQQEEKAFYEVSNLAKELTYLKLGPDILVDIHTKALQKLIKDKDIWTMHRMIVNSNELLLSGIMTFAINYYSFMDHIQNEKRTLEETIKNRTIDIVKTSHELEQKVVELEHEIALRKRADNMLAEAQRVAHIGSWEMDIITKKITWSEEMFHIHNIDPKQGEPTYEELVKMWHPDDIQLFIDAVDKTIKDGVLNIVVFRTICPDNSIRYIEVRAKVIFDDNKNNNNIDGNKDYNDNSNNNDNNKNKVIRLFGTAMDVTTREIVKQEIENTNRELERSNQELQQCAYVTYHDLQEPLRSISSFIELLATNYKNKLGPEADEYINFILNGVKRMHQMISDLLDLSKIDTKTKEFPRTNMREVIDDALLNLKNIISENKAEVTIEDMPIIDVDKYQITRLFQNLIDNAIKFHKKDIPPKIHISAKKEINRWIFSVKDNGIGIDPNDFKKLFIIFQRLNKRDEYPGIGIGLAMCKKIVAIHKGDIWVESKLGEGSTFYFTIPNKTHSSRTYPK